MDGQLQPSDTMGKKGSAVGQSRPDQDSGALLLVLTKNKNARGFKRQAEVIRC